MSNNRKMSKFLSGVLVSAALIAGSNAWANEEAPGNDQIDNQVDGQIIDDEIDVSQDQAVAIKLERKAASIIVGNPTLADVVAHDSSHIFVLARMVGTTNVIAVDEFGDVIINKVIHIEPTQTASVNLFKNAERFSHTCRPECGPTIAPGDDELRYKKLVDQTQRKIQLAEQAKIASKSN